MENEKNAKRNGPEAHVVASDLIYDGKKLAAELYNEGKHKVTDKVNELQDHFKDYSAEMAQKIQDKPLKSLLIAGGVGFLLAVLLRR